MNLRNITNSKILAALCVLFLLGVLAACGGGGGSGTVAPPEPAGDTCDSASIPVDGACQAFAVRLDERAPTPFVEDGLPVELEVVLFRRLDGDRFPLLVFNHGSTGAPTRPSSA